MSSELFIFQFSRPFKINVYEDISGKNMVFKEKSNTSEKYTDLFYHNNLFELINSMMGFVVSSYNYQLCCGGYSKLSLHKCTNACKRCFKSPPCHSSGSVLLRCDICCIFIQSAKCYHRSQPVLTALCQNMYGYHDKARRIMTKGAIYAHMF